MFHYDRRLKDNEEVKDLVSKAWNEALNKSVRERIAIMQSVISEWNRSQHCNSKRLIEEKKAELELTLTSQANNVAQIHKVTAELKAAYAAEEEY